MATQTNTGLQVCAPDLIAKSGSVHFSSATDEWATPQALFDELSWIFGGFTLDPCATMLNAKCSRFFTRTEDGLQQEWTGKVFLDPALRARHRAMGKEGI